jgi:hypothetical protein
VIEPPKTNNGLSGTVAYSCGGCCGLARLFAFLISPVYGEFNILSMELALVYLTGPCGALLSMQMYRYTPAGNRRGQMTVCVASLASNSEAIVCIADKATTMYDTIMSDTDVCKIVPVGKHGTHVLTAGDVHIINPVLFQLQLDTNIGLNRPSLIQAVSKAQKEAHRQWLESRYLSPFLSADNFEQAIRASAIKPMYMKSGEVHGL